MLANVERTGRGDDAGLLSQGTVPSNQPRNTKGDQRVDPRAACAIWIAD